MRYNLLSNCSSQVLIDGIDIRTLNLQRARLKLHLLTGEGDKVQLRFSVGERQLVCLTCSASFHHKFKDFKVLTIAHRLNTIMNYDKVLILGRLELMGLNFKQ